PTMLDASMQANVVAQKASAVINFRIVPGESVKSVTEYVKNIVGKDIEVTVLYGDEPSAVSSVESPAFKAIEQAVKEGVGNDVLVAPYLMMACTDSRHYAALADNTYRFDPFRLGDDLGTVHGVNERLSIEALTQGCRFFISLIEKTA
ncbi:MAG: M20/M25/M40 family metallo-hydrolase, partial [Christensenellaceae bacterium]|nr:M20/M25/M40 family metallo-hydrolase [Christensenellaceae bacterium]